MVCHCTVLHDLLAVSEISQALLGERPLSSCQAVGALFNASMYEIFVLYANQPLPTNMVHCWESANCLHVRLLVHSLHCFFNRNDIRNESSFDRLVVLEGLPIRASVDHIFAEAVRTTVLRTMKTADAELSFVNATGIYCVVL